MRLPLILAIMFFTALAFGRGAESDTILSVVHVVGLDYPRLAHMAGVQGTVELELTIRKDGTVEAVNTISGNGLLAGPAGETLKTWTFSPCTNRGSVCRYLMSIHFVLKGGPLEISRCKTKFEFDNPGVILVASQFAKAIFD